MLRVVIACASVALVGCGSGTKTVIVTAAPSTTSTTASTPATTPTAPTSTPATSTPTGPAALHISTFLSPSGNIGCVIAAGTARCDIRNRDWSPPPRPPGCPPEVDFGQGLEIVGAGHGQFVCAGDTAIIAGSPTLPYNQDTEVGPFRCLSETVGMYCANTTTGHGFDISIQSYRTF